MFSSVLFLSFSAKSKVAHGVFLNWYWLFSFTASIEPQTDKRNIFYCQNYRHVTKIDEPRAFLTTFLWGKRKKLENSGLLFRKFIWMHFAFISFCFVYPRFDLIYLKHNIFLLRLKQFSVIICKLILRSFSNARGKLPQRVPLEPLCYIYVSCER